MRGGCRVELSCSDVTSARGPTGWQRKAGMCHIPKRRGRIGGELNACGKDKMIMTVKAHLYLSLLNMKLFISAQTEKELLLL